LEGLEERSELTGVKVSASHTDHGLSIYNSFNATFNIKMAPKNDGPAIFPPALFKAAEDMLYTQKRPHEQELVNLYTPSLIEVVSEVSP
jgi:hypothetical protein